jgi:hypothetical protein
MTEHQLHKLPVIDEDGKLRGLITSASLLRAFFNYGFHKDVLDLQVIEAMESIIPFEAVDYIKISEYLASNPAALVMNRDSSLRIITSYDTAYYFKQQSEDFMMIGFIEGELKKHILYAYDSTEYVISKELQNAINGLIDKVQNKIDNGVKGLFSRLCKENLLSTEQKDKFHELADKQFTRTIKEFQILTLNDYAKLTSANWDKFLHFNSFPVNVWASMMEGAVVIRNHLAHFRRKLTVLEHDKLKYVESWFRNHPVPSEKFQEAEQFDNSTNDAEGEKKSRKILFEDDKSTESENLLNILVNTVKTPTIIIPFESIEQILAGILPSQARDSEAWWIDIFTNSERWFDAGWRIGQVDLEAQLVTFFHWKIRVNTGDKKEADYWRKFFHCTALDLLDAVQQVGDNPAVVAEYLNRHQQ